MKAGLLYMRPRLPLYICFGSAGGPKANPTLGVDCMVNVYRLWKS